MPNENKCAPTIELTRFEFESYVRESEVLETVRRYVSETDFVNTKDLKAILGLKEGEE